MTASDFILLQKHRIQGTPQIYDGDYLKDIVGRYKETESQLSKSIIWLFIIITGFFYADGKKIAPVYDIDISLALSFIIAPLLVIVITYLFTNACILVSKFYLLRATIMGAATDETGQPNFTYLMRFGLEADELQDILPLEMRSDRLNRFMNFSLGAFFALSILPFFIFYFGSYLIILYSFCAGFSELPVFIKICFIAISIGLHLFSLSRLFDGTYIAYVAKKHQQEGA